MKHSPGQREAKEPVAAVSNSTEKRLAKLAHAMLDFLSE